MSQEIIPLRGQALQELFDKDPLELTIKDREDIILALREQRAQWAEKEKKAKGKKPEGYKIQIDLSDLKF